MDYNELFLILEIIFYKLIREYLLIVVDVINVSFVCTIFFYCREKFVPVVQQGFTCTVLRNCLVIG